RTQVRTCEGRDLSPKVRTTKLRDCHRSRNLIPQPAMAKRGFEMQEKHGYFIEDLAVGMTAVFAKTVSDADITMFAGISGDTNPVHLDQSYAEKTIFAGRIAHGMLSASFIST